MYTCICVCVYVCLVALRLLFLFVCFFAFLKKKNTIKEKDGVPQCVEIGQMGKACGEEGIRDMAYLLSSSPAAQNQNVKSP